MATTMMATRRQVSPEEIAEVLKEFKADPKNKALRNRLIEQYLPLVLWMEADRMATIAHRPSSQPRVASKRFGAVS